jgi:hypothetical protein
MTSQRWNRLVSVLVLGLVLATAGSARAQWGFPAIAGNPGVSQFGLGYGTAQGISPYGFGSFAAAGNGGSSTFIGFPLPGYDLSICQRPQTTASLQSFSNAVTLVPSWSGSAHRVHRRFQAQPSVPRAALRR